MKMHPSRLLWLKSARDFAMQGEEGMASQYVAMLVRVLRSPADSVEARRMAADALEMALGAPERDMRRVLGLQAKARTRQLFAEHVDWEVMRALDVPGTSKQSAYRKVAKLTGTAVSTVKRMHLAHEAMRAQDFDAICRELGMDQSVGSGSDPA